MSNKNLTNSLANFRMEVDETFLAKAEKLCPQLQERSVVGTSAIEYDFYELFDPQSKNFSPYGSPIINSYCHAWSCTPTYFIRKYAYAMPMLAIKHKHQHKCK